MDRPFVLASRVALLGAFLLLLGPRVQAGHLWVDSAHGSDANPGTSPELAFKHIFKALQVGGTPSDKIHIAPGEYSAATGELFPLKLGATSLVGDAGSAVTFVIGSGNDVLFDAVKPGAGSTALLSIEGLSLVGGRTGLRVNSPAGIYQVSLQDLSFDGMSQDGIESHAIPGGAGGSQLNLILFRLTISHCLRGVTFQISSPTMKSVLSVQLCTLRANTVGLNIESSGNELTNVTVSRIEDQGLVGLRSFANGGIADLEVAGCLVARNAVGIEAGGLGGQALLGIRSCTIANNGTGVTTSGFPITPESTLLSNSIVWDNADDLDLAGAVAAEFNDVSQGDFVPLDGNISADPQFRDAAAGDYRLSWGSPAVETGGPRLALDLLGNSRPVDGDFDVVEVNDMGCLEFIPLDLISPAQNGQFPELPLGGLLRLEAWGASGSTAALFVSIGKPLPHPTAFGVLWLDLSVLFPLATLAAGPVTPGVFQANLPLDPVLIGLQPVFQTLASSAVAPKGKALSDFVIFAIGS